MSEKNNIGIWTVCKLLGEKKLTIPEYQRPYSWESEQVISLIEDIQTAMKNKPDKEYLIGNMILHIGDNKVLNIVDGQQRTITLALILYVLSSSKENIECKNNTQKFLCQEISPLSSKALKANLTTIKNRFENRFENFDDKKNELNFFILNNVKITYIKTNDLDEAFVLFDSQNTRGKELYKKDLLKVHHLRKIKKQRNHIAKKWEIIDRDKNEDKKYNLNYTLKLITITRTILRGEQKSRYFANIDEYKEFKAQSDEDTLNNYSQPAIFENFTYDVENDLLSLSTKAIKLRYPNQFENGLDYLPYTLFQSIQGGERFFYFVMKYSKVIDNLKDNTFFTMLDNATSKSNQNLCCIYQSSLMLYFDKFGLKDFDKFAMRVYAILLQHRVSKRSIGINAKVLWDFHWVQEDKPQLNFIKLIFTKYSTKTVINDIDKYIDYPVAKTEKNDIKNDKEKFYNCHKKIDNEEFNKIIKGIINV